MNNSNISLERDAPYVALLKLGVGHKRISATGTGSNYIV